MTAADHPTITRELLSTLRSALPDLRGEKRARLIERVLPLLLAEAERAVNARHAVLDVQADALRVPAPIPHIVGKAVALIATALGMQRRVATAKETT